MNAADTPPVNEVVLSVAIAAQDLLIGPRLPELLGPWFADHPGISSAAPYEIAPEHEPLYHAQSSPPIPRIEFLAGPPEGRYWLASQDDVYVLQVQRDYLALNWRRRGEDYVHYGHLRSQFRDFLSTLSANLSARGGTLTPERVEMTYINLIETSPLWMRASELHRLIQFSFWDLAEYEQAALSYSKSIRRGGTWAGRMHVGIQPLYDWAKQEPRLSLNLTARSGLLDDKSIDSALTSMDVFHDAINETFLKMITVEAAQAWGVRR